MPVAPVVACVSAGSEVPTHSVGAKDPTETVFNGLTVIASVAVAVHPLLSVTVTE
jgi:hypothetical protein